MMKNGAFGEFLENVFNRLEVDFIENCEYDKIIKQQSKLTLKSVDKSYKNYTRYTFKQKEVVMDKPKYVDFAISELSKLRMYDTQSENLQTYFGQENLHLYCLDTDGFDIQYENTKYYQRIKKIRRYIRFQKSG